LVKGSQEYEFNISDKSVLNRINNADQLVTHQGQLNCITKQDEHDTRGDKQTKQGRNVNKCDAV
jgi:hypothetical protein